MADNLFDIELHLLHETELAFLLWDFKRKKKDGTPQGQWVPKSCCEDNGDGTFTMPEMIAIEKGFV